MERELALKCTEKLLCEAYGKDGTEVIRLLEFRFPYSDHAHETHRFFILKYRLMDWDSECWDRFYNDLRSAMAAFGKEANRKYGSGEKIYGKVEYEDEWKHYRDELIPYGDGRPTSSATDGDYGPGNPWAAPGMKISDFIGGVY